MTILWTKITDLPEIVTQAKRGAFLEVETFFPDFRLVHDFELYVTLEVCDPQFLG